MKSIIFSKQSAYGGNGFIKRFKTKWTTTNSEFSKLKSVAIYIPGSEIHHIKNPNSVQHLAKINSSKLQLELEALVNFFKTKAINVQILPQVKNAPPNLMFMRDLMWSTANGIVLSRMGSEIRKNEEKVIANFLIENNLPLTYVIPSPHTFEAADALWLNKKTLLIGVKNRTTLSTINFLKTIYPEIKIIPIVLPKNVQHLLGMLNVVADKKVLIRYQIAPQSLITLLKKQKIKIIRIEESVEITQLQGMNIVTIAPNQIIMPNDCPKLESIYRKNKIVIVKKFDIRELRNAAGGLACLVGILQRR